MQITQEGPEDSFFGIVPIAVEEDTSLVKGSSTLPSEVQSALHAAPMDEDIALVRGQGIMVDNDNEPALETQPNVNDTTCSVFGDWDHFTWIFLQEMEAIPNTSPRMIHFSLASSQRNCNCLSCFPPRISFSRQFSMQLMKE